MENRYIQLYSLKDELAKDFAGVLKRVREMGYTGVEFASGFYGDFTAKELKNMLAELKLDALGAHIRSADVPSQLDFAAELGLKYIIDPWHDMATREDALLAAETFNKVGELCRNAGIKFGYHNHRHEFEKAGDDYLLEIVINNTLPELVTFQLDVGWAAYAGVDCVSFVKKTNGRFELIHVKECSHLHAQDPTTPWNGKAGEGIINWAEVRDAALAQGAKAFIIEREHVYADDIFKCVQNDCEFLKML